MLTYWELDNFDSKNVLLYPIVLFEISIFFFCDIEIIFKWKWKNKHDK